jgi:segregation and condensation protein B
MPHTAAASTEVAQPESSESAELESTESEGAEGARAESAEMEEAEMEEAEFDLAELAYDDAEELHGEPEAARDQPNDSQDEDALDDENEDETDERTEQELAGEMLALIFASPDPLSTGRLGKLLGLKGKKKVQGGLDALALQLAEQGLPLVLRSVAGGWRLFTRPEMGELLSGLTERKPDRISPAALETLAIIAYRQPVTRGAIERIRGVDSDYTVRSLLHRRLIVELGRSEGPGRPFLYGTGFDFLERFGLTSLEELPPLDVDVAARLAEEGGEAVMAPLFAEDGAGEV